MVTKKRIKQRAAKLHTTNHHQKNLHFFTKWSNQYDSGILTSWLERMQKHALQEILKNKTDAPSVAILDIGCGTGQLLSKLALKYKTAKLIGIDLTPAMLKIAKQKLKPYKNIQLQEASVEKLPFKDKSFDYVLTTEAFHHFPDPNKALQEMKRVLKDNSKIILIDVNFGPGISYIFHLLEPGNKKIYSKKDFQKLFKEHHLQLLEQRRVGAFAIYNLVGN